MQRVRASTGRRLLRAFRQLRNSRRCSFRVSSPEPRAVMKALELDETVEYAHSMLGRISYQYDWDFPAPTVNKRGREDSIPSWCMPGMGCICCRQTMWPKPKPNRRNSKL